MDKKNLISSLEKQIVIKPMKPKYVGKRYYEWFNDQQIKNTIDFNPTSIKNLRENVKKTIKDKNTLFFAILFKKLHIGNFKIHNISKKNFSCFFGIMIGDQNFRNKGIGKFIIEYIKKWAIDNSIFNIYAGVKKENFNAFNLYSKMGFKIINTENQTYHLRLNLINQKISLGCAQLNSSYGISNFSKNKMSKNYSKSLLDFAKKKGITNFDFSENYSSNLLDFKKNLKHCKIDTKIDSKNTQFLDYNFLKKKMLNLKKNKIDIDVLYLHNGDDLFSEDGQKLFKNILKLKKEKLILRTGISIYNLKILEKINKNLDVVQIPFNCIDQRFLSMQKKVKNKKIKYYARSIFLQGALLKKVSDDKYLSKLYVLFNNTLQKKNLDKISFCLSSVLNHQIIDKIILGVRSKKELEDIVSTDLYFKKLKIKVNKKLLNYAINPNIWRQS